MREAVGELKAEPGPPQEKLAPPPPWGELVMTPREAFLGPQEVIPFDSAGKSASRTSSSHSSDWSISTLPRTRSAPRRVFCRSEKWTIAVRSVSSRVRRSSTYALADDPSGSRKYERSNMIGSSWSLGTNSSTSISRLRSSGSDERSSSVSTTVRSPSSYALSMCS